MLRDNLGPACRGKKKKYRKKGPKKFKTVIAQRNEWALKNLEEHDRKKVHEMKYCGEYAVQIHSKNLQKEAERMCEVFGNGRSVVHKKFLHPTNKSKN